MGQLLKSKLCSTCLSALICMLLVFVVMFFMFDLGNADLNVPNTNGGDAYSAQMYFKGVQDHGFSGAYVNSSLAAPYGADFRHYPSVDLTTFCLISLISVFTSNFGLTFNIYMLSSYFIVALAALFVLIHL